MWRPQQLNRVDDWLPLGAWQALRGLLVVAMVFRIGAALRYAVDGNWWAVFVEVLYANLDCIGLCVLRDVIERKTLLNGRKMYVTDRKDPDGR